MAGAIAEIFRRHGDDYLQRHADGLLPSHRKAIGDIGACRTADMGGHLCRCDGCSSLQFYYHSCCSRSCPTCRWKDTQHWIEQKQSQLLPVTYFHLVFTLPAQLRLLVRSHQKKLLAVLFRAATSALMDLAADPHYVGGQIGIWAVLHTWTRAMIYHPHLHCIVPGGGICPQTGTWLPARHNYLVPVAALSVMFRARFMAMAKKALPNLVIDPAVWGKPRVVFAKPAVQGSDKLLNYPGRYVHRVAITNARIIDADDRRVLVRCLDRQRQCWTTVSLTPDEFMRRFLQHVLPAGFHKVRSYGFLAPANRQRLQQLQQQLGQAADSPSVRQKAGEKAGAPAGQRPPYGFCPICKTGHLKPIARIGAQGRGPPQAGTHPCGLTYLPF